MVYLAYIILGFTAIQLIISLINLLFRQNFQYEKTTEALVSVLIPARNEEANISNLLNDILQQDYNNIEVIVFDDQSADDTAEIVHGFHESDSRVSLIGSEGLPEGWFGKNYACHCLAQKAGGEFFLFLDADVRISKTTIGKAIHQAEMKGLGLLSVFPKQSMLTMAEELTVPMMNYILLTLLPLIMVNKSSFVSLSAANGQFMLFRSDIYRRILPHREMKDKRAEDIEISKLYKKNRIKTACLAARPDISCRMYTGFDEAINGFSKNVIMFFGGSFMLAILFWIITTLGFVPVLLTSGMTGLAIYLASVAAIRIFVSITSSQPVLKNVIFHFPQQFLLGIIILRAARNKLRRQYTWKGRNIY